MRRYYFVLASLPKLSLDVEPALSFEEIIRLLKLNLTSNDLEKVRIFRKFIDLKNIKAFLLGKQIDHKGNLNEKELEQALLVRTFFSSYVFEYLDRYEEKSEQIRYFHFVTMNFFKEMIQNQRGFLRDYYIFEREYRLIFAALRAKILRRDLEKELEFEDKRDFLISELLKQNEGKYPRRYRKMEEFFQKNVDNPKSLHIALLNFRFRKIEDLKETSKLFSIDQILAYFAQFIIVEDITELRKSEKEGEDLMESLKEGVA